MTTPGSASQDGPPPHRPVAFTPAGIVATLALAAVVLLFLRLGFWQLDRRAEQREINAGIAARLDAPPIPAAGALVDTTGLFYRIVTARGLYDHDRSIILPGRSRHGLPGVHLLTPLRLAHRTDAVFVNRGWVPSPDAASIELDAFASYDSVTVRALVLPFPGRSQSLAPRPVTLRDSAFRRVWFNIDEQALRAQTPYPLLPATLQLLPEPASARDAAQPAVARYPVRLEPPPLDEGPHLGYALQWFSFALIGIVGWMALVLRSRRPPRVVPPAVVAAILVLAGSLPAHAQLRPVDPLDWRVFRSDTWLVAGLGGGALWSHPATLAGTEGRLLEIGNYAVAFRSHRIAVHLGGTLLWHLREDVRTHPAIDGVATSDGERSDMGSATAITAVRLSPDSWPADVVARFGATVPTTSDESGLDRDRTDLLALVAVRYRRGALELMMENGLGINGTLWSEYPQSDVWLYSFGASYGRAGARAVAHLVGRQDGHSWIVRGNEDTHEVRVGFDVGTSRWLSVRYIRGVSDFSPSHGIRLGAGFAVLR